MEWTEVLEVRLSFLATRGEEELPDLDEMVTSGGDNVGDTERPVEDKFFGLERQIDTTPSP